MRATPPTITASPAAKGGRRDVGRVAPVWRSGVPDLRLARLPHHPWHKPSLSVVLAALVPVAVLVGVDRLELGAYTLAGSLLAVFTHHVPYRRRARLHAQLALCWTAGVALSLLVAASTDSVWWRILAVSLIAAVTKVAFEASTVGPPGPVLPIFVFAGMVFVPQTYGQVLLHVALCAASAAVAWCVVMAPALLRRHGPERRSVEAALSAAATHAQAPGEQTRGRLLASLASAWHALAHAAGPHGRPSTVRDELAAELMVAERVLLDPDAVPGSTLRASARRVRQLRSPLTGAAMLPDMLPGTVPGAALGAAQRATQGAAQRATQGAATGRPVLAAFRPGSSSTPYFVRMFVASLAAASLSHLLGVGRPYWAVVTAAAVIQPNLHLTWVRLPQRAIGTVLGVLVFFALAPLAHAHPLWSVALILLLNAVVEFVVPRSYLWGLGLVTPMALLITEFAQTYPPTELVVDRLLDTVLGIVLGALVAFAVPNPHLHRAVEAAVRRLEEASVAAEGQAHAEGQGPADVARRRIHLAHADLRACVARAQGEWWSRRHDDAALARAEEQAYRALGGLGQDVTDERAHA